MAEKILYEIRTRRNAGEDLPIYCPHCGDFVELRKAPGGNCEIRQHTVICDTCHRGFTYVMKKISTEVGRK